MIIDYNIFQKMKHRIFTPFNLIIFLGATALYIYLIVSLSNSLNTESYAIDKSGLYKLDSIKMLSKAERIGGPKSGHSIVFDDETFMSFQIAGMADLSSELNEKLKFSETIMTIYTDKVGYENYLKKDNSNRIKVFELEIGNKKYINIENINDNRRKSNYQLLFIFSLLYLVFLIIHFFRVTRSVPFK